MFSKRKRGASDKATPKTTYRKAFYQHKECLSTVDQLLSGLIFGLQYSHLSKTERATVLDSIDRLLRLKIDLKLSNEVGHVR